MFERAPQVAAIAADLIAGVEQHEALADVRIEYVFRDRAARSKGRVTLAKARRVTGLNAFLVAAADGIPDDDANYPFYVVEVAADTWARLSGDQREALVDHELCHFQVLPGTPPILGLRGHDLEEFGCIVSRHGLWKSDVAHFGEQVAEQLAMAIEEAEGFLADPGSDGSGEDLS